MLDLPTHVLEEITKQLWPRDLFSCMLSCRTLNTMLRPRLAILVRTRHLGRKWALRASGRALFRELGQIWEAGRIKFDSAYEGQHGVVALPESIRNPQSALARKAISNLAALENGFRRRKTAYAGDENIRPTSQAWRMIRGYESERFPIQIFDEHFVFVCNLANAMGFHTALSSLERLVADRADEFYQRISGNPDAVMILAEVRALGRAPRILSPYFFANYLSEHIPPPAEGLVVPSTFWLLPAELHSPLWLLRFLLMIDEDGRVIRGDLDLLGPALDKQLSLGQ